MLQAVKIRVVGAALSLVLGACTLVTGVGDLRVVDDGTPSAIAEAGADVVTPEDAALLDSGAADAATDEAAPPCQATPLDGSPRTAFQRTTPIQVDGDLSDWPCAFTSMDPTDAHVIGTPQSTGSFAIGWDASGIWFACHVVDANPEGTESDPFKNDACEFFIGAPTVAANGAYDQTDLHYVVDYKGLARWFPTASTEKPLPAGALSAGTKVADGFAVELFLPASILGFTPAAGTTELFDMQIDDNQAGVPQAGQLDAYLATTPDIGQCLNEALHQPACDTRLWGTVNLAP